MNARVRYWLGPATAAAAATLLLLVLLLLNSSPYSLNSSGSKSLTSAGSRKLSSLEMTLTHRLSSESPAVMKHARESLRRIPPSTSNPTQNKARPRIDRPGKVLSFAWVDVEG